MVVKIQRTSTLEANVSQRTVKYNVLVEGVIITAFDGYEEAEELKESLENGDITVDWSKVSK